MENVSDHDEAFLDADYELPPQDQSAVRMRAAVMKTAFHSKGCKRLSEDVIVHQDAMEICLF